MEASSGDEEHTVQVLWKAERPMTAAGNTCRGDTTDDTATESDASDHSTTVFDVHQTLHLQRPREASRPRDRRRLVEFSKHVPVAPTTASGGATPGATHDVGIQATSLHQAVAVLESRIDHMERRLKREEARNQEWSVRMENAEKNLQQVRNQINHVLSCCDAPHTLTHDTPTESVSRYVSHKRSQSSRPKMDNFGDADYSTVRYSYCRHAN